MFGWKDTENEKTNCEHGGSSCAAWHSSLGEIIHSEKKMQLNFGMSPPANIMTFEPGLRIPDIDDPKISQKLTFLGY